MQRYKSFIAPFITSINISLNDTFRCPSCLAPISITSDITQMLCEECWGHWCPSHADRNQAVWVGPCDTMDALCPKCAPKSSPTNYLYDDYYSDDEDNCFYFS